MPLKWKLAIGVGLGVGAAFAGPFSAIFAGGIALQRAAGLAGMYVKSKNILQKMSEGTHRGFFAKGEYKGLFAHDYHEFFKDKSETQRKWIAFAMAGVYTAGMGLAIGEAVHYAPQFLHHMLGHDGGVDGGAVQSGGNVPEWMHPAQMPTHTEMPNLSVDASAGHGYEFMAKRLWEQAQAQHLDPSKYAADSDMHKLLTADAHSIDKVVHQIAADPKHAFFNHDGTSVMIDPHAHMTIGADGNIHVGAEVHAAAGAHTTPVYPHHEAPVAHAEAPATVEAHHAPDSSVADVKHDLTNENVIDHQSPTHDAPHAAPEVEQLAGQILHHHGIDIPTAEPHIYADNHTKHLFVFGGKPGLEQTTLIKNYLSANPDKIVYGTDDSGKYRIPFHWFQKPDGGGDIVPGIPVQKRGFLGFFKSFMGAPDPKEFHAKIS